MAYKVFLGGAVGTAGNYDPSGVPSDGDTIILDYRTTTAVTGADQSSIEPAAILVYSDCTVQIGTAAVPWLIGPVRFECGITPEGGSTASGPPNIYMDFGADPVTAIVHNARTGGASGACVNFRGTEATNKFIVAGGSVGIGTIFPGEATTAATIDVSGSNSVVTVGRGVTLTTLNAREGTVNLGCAATTVNLDSGSIYTTGSGAITTANIRGLAKLDSTGTITTLNVSGDGEVDLTTPLARTITNTAMYGTGAKIDLDGNALSSGVPPVTLTNGIDLLQGAKSTQVNAPTGLTIQFSTL